MYNHDITPVSVYIMAISIENITNAWIPALDFLSSTKGKSVKITDGTKEERFLWQ